MAARKQPARKAAAPARKKAGAQPRPKPAAPAAPPPKAKKPKRGSSAAEHPPSKGKDAGSSPAPAATDTTAQLLRRRGAQDQQHERPLTDAEEAFLTEYMRNGQNGTAAWIFVNPGTPPNNAAVNAYALLRKPQVQARLQAERKRLATKHEIDRDQLLLEFLAIVRANPNDLTQIRCVACRQCWGGETALAEAGQRATYLDPDPECKACLGEGQGTPWFADTRKLSPEALALFAGVQQTKEGIKVLMHDKMAALVNIGRILGAFEKDNRQQGQGTAEALREFFAGMHGNRLPIAKHQPKADAAPAGSGNPLVGA